MDVDRRLEQLYERVTLVEGMGSRRRAELCVMSFVALLAGEGHTDRPASASPLIRNLAMRINDAMPYDARQRLKPFAPRMVGTNDGRDQTRVEVLRQFLSERLLPLIRRERSVKPLSTRPRQLMSPFPEPSSERHLEARAAELLARVESGVLRGGAPVFASDLGDLLAGCMRDAPTGEKQAAYWSEAIILLDQLCDVGKEARHPVISGDRIALAEERLGGSWLSSFTSRLPRLGRAGEPTSTGVV